MISLHRRNIPLYHTEFFYPQLRYHVKASERVYYDKYEQKIETGVEYESFNLPQLLHKKKNSD